MTPRRGQANVPIGNTTAERRRKRPKQRNTLPYWDGPTAGGDEFHIRGFASEGSRLGGHIHGTRPDLNITRLDGRRAA